MSRVLTVDQGDYIVQVENGRTVIDSDIMVTGKPYGTAPVVTNVLYVTMDGSDTNDGSAQDPTRACRTISGAVKSPLYQPGTSIKVAAGRYLENNPIVVKPYTSIIGSDLRTTAIEPINKTQDLFHVNSSSYLAQMQFINGRSGIVNPNLDRGAYTVAFPINYKFSFTGSTEIGSSIITAISSTDNIVIGMEISSPVVLVGSDLISLFPIGATVLSIDSDTQITMSSVSTKTTTESVFATGKITVYKSPYVQNCTNQTGPWLYDGTMFIPNQTVQVPSAVGKASFSDGDGTVDNKIRVAVSEGSIVAGMSINTAPQDQGFFTARTLILANIQFIQEQVLQYILISYPTFIYDKEKCSRDIRTIIEHVLYDTTFGGNSKSVQSGYAYWNGAVSYVAGEIAQTRDAMDKIKGLVTAIINQANGYDQVPDLYAGYTVDPINIIPGKHYTIVTLGTIGDVQEIWNAIAGTTNVTYSAGDIIVAKNRGEGNGTAKFGIPVYIPSNIPTGAEIVVEPFNYYIELIKSIIGQDISNPITVPVFYSTGPEFGLDSAEILLQANKAFIQEVITAYISYNYPAFNDSAKLAKSARDVGYIVDAISQDILLGGNARSYEMGVSYYLDNVSVLSHLETAVCLSAISEIATIMKAVVQNFTYTQAWTSGLIHNQVKYTNLLNGGITTTYIDNNITIIKTFIDNGPVFAKATYKKHTGTTLFLATGVSADNVQQATKVVTVTDAGPGSDNTHLYDISIDNPAVGIGNNSTLYFGYTTVYPFIDSNVTDRWASRKCDPWGAMGGMLIDGDVVTDNSPIRSFVADAFTQVNQGGRGVRVTNRGYVQLVSVFTIFSSIAVEADNGGIASITNSNANFGTYCMIAKGYGPREFSGTIFNPAGFAYNSVSNSFEVNQYYPSGFFPHKQQVCVFVPDTQYRPHIALMLEVIPPTTYINAQGKSGFLTSTVTFATITEGDLTISGIDVSDMYIGQNLFLHDQYGSYFDLTTNVSYLQEGTVITDIGPQTIYLSKPITQSGGDIANTSYFTLFSCGNAYYTILSSTISNNPSLKSDGKTPINPGGLILPTAQVTDTIINTVDQGTSSNPEIASLEQLGSLLKSVVSNNPSITYQPKSYISNKSFVIGTSYTVSTIGTTTNSEWNEIGGTTGVTYNVGSIFTAASAGSGNGNGIAYTVTAPQKFDSGYNGTDAENTIYNPGPGNTPGLIDNIITIITNSATITPLINNTNKYDAAFIVKQTPMDITLLTKGVETKAAGDAAQLIRNNLEFCVEEISAFIRNQIDTAASDSNWYQLDYLVDKCRRDVRLICMNVAYDLESGGNYNSIYSGLSYYSRPGTYHIVQLEDNVTDYNLVPDGAIVNFYQRSYMSASGYLFEYVGAGTNYGALPQVGRVDPNQPNEVNMLDGGKVFFTSTDQNGDFRIGPGLVISQATGVLSGRTFQKSLFAEMTPFILAIEG